MPSAPTARTRRAFEKVKSKEEEQQEARAAVDTAPLIAQIDGHTGRANLMAVPFSQLVNAMEAQGTLAVGAIQDKYYDGAAERAKGAEGKWSVAVSIGALGNWEIHAHCDLEGDTARGENAIHIKRTSERYSRGVDSPHATPGGSSHPASDGQAGCPGPLTRPGRRLSPTRPRRRRRRRAKHPAEIQVRRKDKGRAGLEDSPRSGGPRRFGHGERMAMRRVRRAAHNLVLAGQSSPLRQRGSDSLVTPRSRREARPGGPCERRAARAQPVPTLRGTP
jgi:hypothetical protein